MRVFIPVILMLAALWPPSLAAAAAESPGCRQARQIVAGVGQLYGQSPIDHRAILNRLTTARDLCPSLGEAWKLSACSARALGLEPKARIYSDRAVLNGVGDLSCNFADSGGPAGGPPAAPEMAAVRDKFALVVGIGTFQDSRIPHLRYTAKDARDFHSYLLDPNAGRFDPDNVELLIDRAATRENILKAIQRIFLRATERDLLVVYVSSHGSPLENKLGLQGVGYIVTHDTDLDDIYVNSLEFQSFSEKISLIKAARKITFLDTCYSGQARRTGSKDLVVTPLAISAESARLFTSTEGSYLVTSSDTNEKSWESDRLQNSFFTYHLLAALRQAGEPPTLKDVFASLAQKVATGVLKEKNAGQHPQLHPASASGDVRIGAPPDLPASK